MATFEIKRNHSINILGDYKDRGLSVQVCTMFFNTFFLQKQLKFYKNIFEKEKADN